MTKNNLEAGCRVTWPNATAYAMFVGYTPDGAAKVKHYGKTLVVSSRKLVVCDKE